MPKPWSRHRRSTALVVLSMVISFVACSDSGDSSAGGGTATSRPATTTSLVYRTVAADVAPPGATTVGMTRYRFDPPNLEVKAGTVVFFLHNTDAPTDDSLEAFDRKHSLAVAGPSGLPIAVSERVEPQRAAVFTIEALPPGQYKIRCSIAGHAADGMVGTLDVTA